MDAARARTAAPAATRGRRRSARASPRRSPQPPGRASAAGARADRRRVAAAVRALGGRVVGARGAPASRLLKLLFAPWSRARTPASRRLLVPARLLPGRTRPIGPVSPSHSASTSRRPRPAALTPLSETGARTNSARTGPFPRGHVPWASRCPGAAARPLTECWPLSECAEHAEPREVRMRPRSGTPKRPPPPAVPAGDLPEHRGSRSSASGARSFGSPQPLVNAPPRLGATAGQAARRERAHLVAQAEVVAVLGARRRAGVRVERADLRSRSRCGRAATPRSGAGRAPDRRADRAAQAARGIGPERTGVGIADLAEVEGACAGRRRPEVVPRTSAARALGAMRAAASASTHGRPAYDSVAPTAACSMLPWPFDETGTCSSGSNSPLGVQPALELAEHQRRTAGGARWPARTRAGCRPASRARERAGWWRSTSRPSGQSATCSASPAATPAASGGPGTSGRSSA